MTKPPQSTSVNQRGAGKQLTWEIELSLIIPAFNESHRMLHTLKVAQEYLTATFNDRYEVIFVDDGSSDGTSDHAEKLQTHWPQLKLFQHKTNLGKGAAVRTGMLAAQGRLLLFADADGATPLIEEQKLRHAINEGAAIAVGSRRLKSDAPRKRTFHRRLLSTLFAHLVESRFQLGIQDTQCGFKMFRRDAGQVLFLNCHQDRYLFDIEILWLARRLELPITEVAVSWCEMRGSRVNLWQDGWNLISKMNDLGQQLSNFTPSPLPEIPHE